MFRSIIHFLGRVSLVKQIVVALILAALFINKAPITWIQNVGILGELFVTALKSVAPILVFILVLSAITQFKATKHQGTISRVITLYLVGTFLAALITVMASYAFPVKVILTGVAEAQNQAPSTLAEVLGTILFKMVDNPINALSEGNYMGLLSWAALLGLSLRHTSENTKKTIEDLANAVSFVVRVVIHFAPFGIFGIVCSVFAQERDALVTLNSYLHLLYILIGCMVFVALVINPLLVFIATRQNPYPLVFKCLRVSGLNAFFTRSSAANIPVNMELCKELKLDPQTYSVTIPLGATINMAGAAVTITVMALAAVHTLGMNVSIYQAIVLCFLASIAACGASGVAGGSLLLIPLACSLFDISADISAQLIGIGFIIGILQDSTETALNSSTDVLFTAAAEKSAQRRQEKINA